MPDAIEKPGLLYGWNKHSVRKLGGQGEFDNLHIAPRMTVKPDLLKLNPKLQGLDSIVMAPFCIHDCFHMHWRWGEKLDSIQARGWSPMASRAAPQAHHWSPQIRRCESNCLARQRLFTRVRPD